MSAEGRADETLGAVAERAPEPRPQGLRGPVWMWLVARLVGLLPYRALRSFGAALGALVGGLVRVRRRHVESAMARAGVPRPRRAAAAMYGSLGAGLFELLWTAGRPKEPLEAKLVVSPRAADLFARALAQERGVVVATAHTGNWDLSACAAAAWLRDHVGPSGRAPALHVITKRLSWRALDRTWQHLRAERGVLLVDARGATMRVREALARGDVVAMMIDQAPERATGVTQLPFLGAPAWCDLAPILMASRARAPIVVAFGRRRDDGLHEFDAVDLIEPEALATRADVERIAARITDALASFVETYPAQWLWLHRRWKELRRTKKR
ncbi:lysophospholipid acyltransferase family protein [Polyangium sp. y55x31]|uniref:lysophospholipid acyltransferase family protein n=1 Tax=Polyangium sp. y55x31 TaxID=3042688 RepID=UPI0024824DCA|nr:lysophospholipid acyltransferase family protein [Polyangium sp. y55x31]MDI1476116.1 lysophospholipid acyltransferase family protein [Polyangium sp. y55x31]